MLHTAGRPDEQSSVGSSQHSSFSALVRSSRSAHAPPLCCTAGEIDAIVERTRRVLDLTLEDPEIRAVLR